MICAVSERSGGFCIRFNYGVRSGSKMTRKCDTTVFGIKLEAENGIQALRYFQPMKTQNFHPRAF